MRGLADARASGAPRAPPPPPPRAAAPAARAPAAPPAAGADAGRRALLGAAVALLAASTVPSPAARAALPARVELPAGDEVPLEVRLWFADAVASVRSALGGDGALAPRGARRREPFSARLAIYGVTRALPSGTPGDPARDFGAGAAARCGAFLGGGAPAPYAACPLPGAPPPTSEDRAAANDCCRHYAFAIPYAVFAPAAVDRASTVVVAPRLLRLPPERWRAVLAHELGHAADFFLFGRRYRLRDRRDAVAAAEPALRALLEAADAEADAEVRADLLADALLLRPAGARLCYDPAERLQLLAPAGAACDGDGAGGELMRHYLHAPIRAL
jgi:hypothetical protein